MTVVSYQLPSTSPVVAAPRFGPLGDAAITTRSRDAKVTVKVDLSKRQARWLRDAASARRSDEGAILRALVDLGMELPVDWAATDGARTIRTSVRDAVWVRHD